MIVAIDTETDRVVTDTAVAATTADTHTHQQGRYQCLFCGAPLAYTGSARLAVDGFTPVTGTECFQAGNVSLSHRRGQELISATICNWLPLPPDAVAIDLEKYVGPTDDHIIADVRLRDPIHLVVEVMYLSSGLRLRSRLRTLFQEGYSGLVVVMTNAAVSARRVERHLNAVAVGPVEVGRIDPERGVVNVGSVLTPETVDLSPTAWDAVPAYLA
jgi:hypothetical protein